MVSSFFEATVSISEKDRVVESQCCRVTGGKHKMFRLRFSAQHDISEN